MSSATSLISLSKLLSREFFTPVNVQFHQMFLNLWNFASKICNWKNVTLKSQKS